MATIFTNTDQTKTTVSTPVYNLAAGTTLVVGADATLAAQGDYSAAVQSAGDVDVQLAGDLYGTQFGIKAGMDSAVRITQDGSILSGDIGIRLTGAAQDVTNAGTIMAEQLGVELGDGRIANSGLISAAKGITVGGEFTLTNSGRIEGVGTALHNGSAVAWGVKADGAAVIHNSGEIVSAKGVGIFAEGAADERVTIVNTGLIGSHPAGFGVWTGAAEDSVQNDGTIIGEVRLGAGHDLYDGRAGKLLGPASGGQGDDTLLGGAGQERFEGGAGADEIDAGAGDDEVDGGDGIDVLQGGAGFDTLSFASSFTGVEANLATGEGGGDVFAGFEGLRGSAHADNLAGSALADRLIGGAGADSLTGSGGDDGLLGMSGQDLLHGGTGADWLRGGVDADTFRYANTAESTVAAKGRDRILDFNQAEGDVVNLASIDADTGLAGNQTFSFVGTAAFSKQAGELRYETLGQSTLLSGDINGDGTADFAIQFSGSLALAASDFVL